MPEGTPISMRGVITGTIEEGGWLANMTHPVQISEVELPSDALHFTRVYPNERARTRITDLACPDLPVTVGDQVVAHVVPETGDTGELVLNPRRWDWDEPRFIPKVEIVGGSATKWGLRSPK